MDIIMNELKPCPFCGGEPTYHPYKDFLVICGENECPATRFMTIEQWNRRVPEWISVKDRLPEFDTKVLIFDNFVFTGCYTDTGWLNYYDHSHENPSHWMPLPGLPT